MAFRDRLVVVALAAGLLACGNSPGGPDGGSSSTRAHSSSTSRARGTSSSGSSGSSSSSASNGTSSGSSVSTGLSSSGSSSGGASSSSTGSSGGSTGVLDAGVVTAFSALSSLPASVQSWSDDPASGTLWVVTDGRLPDGGTDNGVYVLDDTTLETVADVPLPANVVWDGLTWTPFAPSYILAVPGLDKVYFGALTGPGVIDAMDEKSYAVTTVADLLAIGETPVALAYDPTQQLVYASVNSFLQTDAGAYFTDPGYVLVMDATSDTLVNTLHPFDVNAVASPTCATTSSTSCFSSQVDLAVDAIGGTLYFAGQDQYSEPMTATFPLAGSTLQDVSGGLAGGWRATANGIATFGDGGAMVALEIDDGGGALEQLAPPSLSSAPFHPTAVAPLSFGSCAAIGGGAAVAFTDTAGNPEIDAYSWGQRLGPLIHVASKAGAQNACVGADIVSMQAKMKSGFQVNGQSESCLVLTVGCQDTSSRLVQIAEAATQLCCP